MTIEASFASSDFFAFVECGAVGAIIARRFASISCPFGGLAKLYQMSCRRCPNQFAKLPELPQFTK
jgi:hypothetical protein